MCPKWFLKIAENQITNNFIYQILATNIDNGGRKLVAEFI